MIQVECKVRISKVDDRYEDDPTAPKYVKIRASGWGGVSIEVPVVGYTNPHVFHVHGHDLIEAVKRATQ